MRPSVALHKHRQGIRDIIAAHSVSNPRVFGSVVRGEDTDASDLDILVDKSERTTYFEIFEIEREIHTLVGVRVEIYLSSEMKPHVRKCVIPEAVAL